MYDSWMSDVDGQTTDGLMDAWKKERKKEGRKEERKKNGKKEGRKREDRNKKITQKERK